MWKEKVLIARDFIVRNSKFVFPIVVIAVVAMTVTIALGAGNAKEEKAAEESSATESTEQTLEPVEKDVTLVANEDPAIFSLIQTFYNAQATGDEDALRSICDEISDKDMLRYLEIAKYTQSYPLIEVYTKPGLEEGTTVAYVYYKVVFDAFEEAIPGYQAHYICTNDQGELYLKRSDNSVEVNEYFKTVSLQNDVVEFNNRINAEYNELMEQKPEILVYLGQLDSQVGVAVGEGLAQIASKGEADIQVESQQNQEATENAGEGEATTQAPADGEVQYATATTTVNVRSSDSEQADKLGKVIEGTKIQVLEQRLNGWTKVMYEKKEGFIKSEYLQVAESTQSAANVESVGKVTATTNVNVRASASETGDKLGTLVGGASAELIAKENGWCKIKFDGQVGYVKADYVQ